MQPKQKPHTVGLQGRTAMDAQLKSIFGPFYGGALVIVFLVLRELLRENYRVLFSEFIGTFRLGYQL